jgi:integrase
LRVWEPAPNAPALIILVDEYAELIEEAPGAERYTDSIARRGRAPAVTLVAATQRPSQRAMGKGAVRSQMDVRLSSWSPRELRHSFVSIMSDQGVPIETIADLVGHAGTSVTEAVYRHQLRPVITKGARP